MLIAFIVSDFPALSETFILEQIVGLKARGHTVDIFADRPRRDGTGHPDIARYRLLERTFYRPGSALALLLALVRQTLKTPHWPWVIYHQYRFHWREGVRHLLGILALADRPAYDLIHSQFGPNGLKALLARRLGLSQAPLITSFHGYDFSQYPKRYGPGIYAALFEEGEQMLAVSAYVKTKLIALGCPASKIAVLPTGVDCSKFEPKDSSPAVSFRIVSVGRLTEKKGFDIAIRAVAQLLSDYPDMQYTIIGAGTLAVSLREQIRSMGVEGNIHLVGEKSGAEVAALLRASDVLIAPSVTASDGDEESMPVVLKEAMSVGLAVIGSRHASIPELIEDGVSGFLVPERDVEALADRLRELIAQPERVRQLGQAAREAILRDYDYQGLNDRLVQLYNQVLTVAQPAQRVEIEPEPLPA